LEPIVEFGSYHEKQGGVESTRLEKTGLVRKNWPMIASVCGSPSVFQ